MLLEAVAGCAPASSSTSPATAPTRAALEALADERGASDRVRFHGRLPTDALQELLRSASVAAVPSRWYENQPIAVLEAFASGVPVVATTSAASPS